MVVVNKCCCGCSLRTATFIICIFHVDYSLVMIGTSINSLQNHHYIDDLLSVAVENFNELILTDDAADTLDNNLELNNFVGGSTAVEASHRTRVTKTELVISIFFGVIQTICGLLLMYGVIQEEASILLPWELVQFLLLIAITVMGVTSCIKLNVNDDPVIAFIIEVVVLVLYFLVTVYALLIVYSYYRALRDNPPAGRAAEDKEKAREVK